MNQKPYIIEKVYVETPVDTDGDGKKDLIAVYLRLPKEVEEGKKRFRQFMLQIHICDM